MELKALPRAARSRCVGVKPCWPELEDKVVTYIPKVFHSVSILGRCDLFTGKYGKQVFVRCNALAYRFFVKPSTSCITDDYQS